MIFDNNRRWCANVELFLTLFPDMRILCCVRNPAAIVDSLERLIRAHPLAVSAITGGESNQTVYERVRRYMLPDGLVGFALHALRTAWYGAHRDRLILVRYDDLCRFPAETMADIHKLLGEKPFKYDFEALSPFLALKSSTHAWGPPAYTILRRRSYTRRERRFCPRIFSKPSRNPFGTLRKKQPTLYSVARDHLKGHLCRSQAHINTIETRLATS